ncbi:MAG: hypothetical protein R3359_03310 [Marinirhabdus sp.]|nr:hypothetical protein [Marinirhabdus sp.]
MEDISVYLGTLLTFVSNILAVLYVIGITKHGKAYRYFTGYLVLIAIIQTIMHVYAQNEMNNIFLFQYYFIGQFIFLSLFYKVLIQKKWILWIMIMVLTVLGIQYVVNPGAFSSYHTIGVSVTQSIIVIYAVIYYYLSLSGRNLFLLINTGILLYFMTSILYFASGNLIISLDLPKGTQRYINLGNQVLYGIFLVFVFIEWYRHYRIKIRTVEERSN